MLQLVCCSLNEAGSGCARSSDLVATCERADIREHQRDQSVPDTRCLVVVCLQDMLESMGESVEMKRMGQPCECATCYVFLASEDGSYISGQTIHPNGGTVVNG